MFDAHPLNGGTSWHAGSGATWDLTSNALRPAGWTSADAAGLPIFPGLVRYDEAVTNGAINHALRFTCPTTRKAYISPARHWASSQTSASYMPMGARVQAQGERRHLVVSGRSARDPHGAQEVRDVPRRQRQWLLSQRRAGLSLERRQSRDARPPHSGELRAREDGDDRDTVADARWGVTQARIG